MSSRRNFIQQSVAGLGGAALLPLLSNQTRAAGNESKEGGLQVGMAGFTFAKFWRTNWRHFKRLFPKQSTQYATIIR